MLRWAAPLAFAALGGLFERSGVVNIALEGMMLMRYSSIGRGQARFVVAGAVLRDLAGGLAALYHAFFSIHLRGSDRRRDRDQHPRPRRLPGYLFIDIYGTEGTPTDIPSIPDVHLSFIEDVPLIGDVFGQLNLMITWIAILLVFLTWVVVFRTPSACGSARSASTRARADTVGINVYGVRYGAVVLSGMLAAAGGAYLSIGFIHSFNEGMTDLGVGSSPWPR